MRVDDRSRDQRRYGDPGRRRGMSPGTWLLCLSRHTATPLPPNRPLLTLRTFHIFSLSPPQLQLSMHSIRETMGVCDLTNGLALFRAFFEHFREVDDAVQQ